MARRSERRADERHKKGGLLPLTGDGAVIVRPGERVIKPLAPMNLSQDRYMTAISNNQITFGIGPAGTGKTFLAAGMAAEAFKTGEIRKIIVTRPAVEAGENLGYLPGELEEKYEPYFRPVKDAFIERLCSGPVEYMVKSGQIEAIPLAYLRGMTFKDAWVILDEAQNTTPVQMKLFLTRIGANSRVIINGDPTQIDLPPSVRSGLADAVHKLRGLGGVSVIEFSDDDIVRSGIVAEIIRRYSSNAPSADRYNHDSSEDYFQGLLRVVGQNKADIRDILTR